MADVFINPSRMETLSAAIGSICSSVKWQDAHNTWKAREYGFHTTLIENSMVINDSQPEYCMQRAMHILNQHSRAQK